MRREDLLELDADKLAALANRGLVKRAEKMLQENQAPVLEVAQDGTVTASEGEVRTILPPGVPLKDSRCSCGSLGVCRHRILAVLAYQASCGSAVESRSWSPSVFTDEQLERLLGARGLARARQEAARGLVAEVRRGSLPSVALATTTVQFLVADHLEHARCDCRERTACTHLALAVWAFREADATVPQGEQVTVALAAREAAQEGWSEALAACGELLVQGVSHAGAGLLGRLEREAGELERRGWAWPADLMGELRQSLEAYAARASHYETRQVRRLLAELLARQRASRPGGELPSRVVLGQGESGETQLNLLDMVGLGARVRKQGEEIQAEVFQAEPASGTVLVLRKSWPGSELNPSWSIASGVSLAGAAGGRLVTAMARRRPNRLLTLGRGKTTVSPQAGHWDSLPEPLLVRGFATLQQEPAPPFLGPRLLARGVRVLAVDGVGDVGYARSSQTLRARLLDSEGRALTLRREHRSATPGALEAILAALREPLRFVSGVLHSDGQLELEPLALVTDRVIVPDLCDPMALELPETFDPPRSRLDALLDECAARLEDGCQRGLLHQDRDWRQALAELASRCGDWGLAELSEHLKALARTGEPAAWLDAALTLELCRFVQAHV